MKYNPDLDLRGNLIELMKIPFGEEAFFHMFVAYQKSVRENTTQPQLTEERYVLHGDIQPCTVLYSDDTTTLLRLPEGDMMCETETIEWSDSVTYRCQELLRSVDVRSLGHVSPRLAQLVRDERILLNDNGGSDCCVKAQEA